MTKILTFLTRATRKAFLGPAEALLLLRMAGWVLLLSVAVKIFPLPRALSLVSTKTRLPLETPEGKTQKRLADAIDLLLKADLFILKPICWKRAALLHRYLALNGIPTRILFGMRREPDGRVSGHAWLEASGEPILEATAPNYAVTYSFPSHETFDVDLNLLISIQKITAKGAKNSQSYAKKKTKVNYASNLSFKSLVAILITKARGRVLCRHSSTRRRIVV